MLQKKDRDRLHSLYLSVLSLFVLVVQFDGGVNIAVVDQFSLFEVYRPGADIAHSGGRMADEHDGDSRGNQILDFVVTLLLK